MSTIQLFEEMSLDELELLGDPLLLERYEKEITAMEKDRIGRMVISNYYGDSLLELDRKIESKRYDFEMHHRSETLFPNELVEIYPGIKTIKSKGNITCDFSGARIAKGSLYISYRPLIQSLTNGDAYVLKRTMKVETGYEYDLPTNIGSLETLYYRMISHRDSDDGINYDHLFWQMGGELDFIKLKRRKKYEIRYSK